jgi:hypothetical protein
MRGSIVMKSGENDARVYLATGEADVGDRVEHFRYHCDTGHECIHQRIGEGTVTSRIDEHYVTVWDRRR